MARRVALALLALALVAASVAHAATSPATTSKGKKGKGGGGSSSCPSAASCGLATVAQLATLSIYNREYSNFFTSSLTLDSTNPANACDVTDEDGDEPTDWTVNCGLSTAFAPKTLNVKVTCPVDAASGALGSMTQLFCEAYITDGQGAIISGLPTYTSGFWGDEGACMVNVDGLSDGQTVSISTGVECSNYVPIVSGAKAAPKAKLSKFIKKN